MTEFPIFTCTTDEKGGWSFYCAWCRTLHSHGPGRGHRVAHCSGDHAPLHKTGGYILRRGGFSSKSLQADENMAEIALWFASMAALVNPRVNARQLDLIEAMFQRKRRDMDSHEILCVADAVRAQKQFRQPTQRRQPMTEPTRRPKVELLKDGNLMGIRTTAATYEEFMGALAGTLANVIESGRFAHDWQYQLELWLPNAFEIGAKLKGYKADVYEERVIYAGVPLMRDAEVVNADFQDVVVPELEPVG